VENKLEIRNSKSETNSKVPNPNDRNAGAGRKSVLNFEVRSFGFVSDLRSRPGGVGFRISCLTLLCFSLSCHSDRACRDRLSQIDAVVQAEIQAGNFPGAVVLVGHDRKVLYEKAFGLAISEPTQEPMRMDTIFDLASMTKPLATGAAVMVLVDRGRLDPNAFVREYLPSFACGGKEEVRIKHLLTHTSGLPAYTDANSLKTQYGSPCPEKVIEKICGLDAQSAPGEKFRYSCLGYITLAEIVRTVTGQTIDEFTRENLFVPLGMKDTGFNPPAAWKSRIAATEIVDGEPLRGTVHDPLARLRAGVSGNAGLFSTASDLAIYCRMLLDDGRWKGRQILSPAAVAMLTKPQSHGRAYGFDVSSDYSWVKGPNASPNAFCHTGYTGTSVVVDPDTGLYLILLTNRAHPHDGGASKPVREKLAEIVFPPRVSN
jgi:CubicO group peptidase (beta-lactamase class C family)